MLETPEKPVTLAVPQPTMWSLAFGLGASFEQARAFQHWYDRAVGDPDPGWAVLLAHRWQELARNVPDDEVTVPWATRLHHEIADLLERRDAPGKKVKLEAGKKITCPRIVRLTCKHCGWMFESRYRGGRFPRTCGGICFRNPQKAPRHARGGLTGYTAGMYTHRRAGSRLGVEQYGQEVLCSHPDCLRLFMSTRGDEQYCDEHAGKREQARRRRSRRGPAKHLRFLFELAPGVNGAQYSHGSNSEEVRLEPLETLDTVFGFIGQAIAKVATEPHWHLRLLGVDPGHQGGGLGAVVLRHGLDRAADTGYPVVLETFAERSVPFYLRNGFEFLVDDVEPGSGLRFWALHHVPRRLVARSPSIARRHAPLPDSSVP